MLCAETIRPAMESFGAYLKEKGYSYRVIQDRGEPEANKTTLPPSISIELLVEEARIQPRFGYPSLTARCDKEGKIVMFHKKTTAYFQCLVNIL